MSLTTGTELLRRHRRSARSLPSATLLALLAGSWSVYLAWGHASHTLDHNDALATWTDVVGFSVGWTVMAMAMMLPAATELFATIGEVARRRGDGRRIHLAVAGAFAAVWLLVGLAFRAGDIALHAVAGSRVEHRTVIATLAIGAGLYQFTSLKRQCLSKCRNPRGLVIRAWSGRHAVADSARIGSSYGWSCVGCCWALMLLMFGLGAANPYLMISLGTLTALERATQVGRHIAHLAGLVLIAVGFVLLTQ